MKLRKFDYIPKLTRDFREASEAIYYEGIRIGDVEEMGTYFRETYAKYKYLQIISVRSV